MATIKHYKSRAIEGLQKSLDNGATMRQAVEAEMRIIGQAHKMKGFNEAHEIVDLKADEIESEAKDNVRAGIEIEINKEIRGIIQAAKASR